MTPSICFIQIKEDQSLVKKTFAELEDNVVNLQQIIENLGASVGCRVLYVGDFTFDSFSLFLACIAKGIIWSSAAADIGTSELKYKITAIDPVCVIYTDHYIYKSKGYSLKDRFSESTVLSCTYLIWASCLQAGKRSSYLLFNT